MNDRQRAHSASSLKSLSLYSIGPKWTKRQQTRSTPELRLYMQQSMLSGLNTTVPQSLIPHDISRSHRPKPRPRRHGSCGEGCRECCSARLVLAVIELLIGAAITGLGLYLHFFVTTSLRVRETPYWAGIPLFLAGVLGIYHSANDYENYSGTTKSFVLKAVCFALSLICIFVCLVAATFPVIHLVRLHTYEHCELVSYDCNCYGSHDNTTRLFTYEKLGDCDLLFCFVKIMLMAESATCVFGSIVSFLYVILLWRSKYGGIYTGVRYSLTSNGHV
ncbi:hypothetical protein FSP39_008475 [Pinctada imbricata]|uniref:Sarcospan n=1 Tax=Pinctada imbricata TaxID=66713 RepID=A0AA89BZ48_PINIB|nr:hypothetical protein FSP39_008475 [Pinctada imbricata]